MTLRSSPLEEVLSALRSGRVVIVVDSADRENEGDFVCAAETVTPAIVDFLLTKGRGLLCAPMSQDVADRLRLSAMVPAAQNNAPMGTAFLIPVDHRDSGTGVSLDSRTLTLRQLASPLAVPEDFVRPGHIPPPGGQEWRGAASGRPHGGDG